MAFREKISWLSLGGILVAFGPYFYMVGVLRRSPFTLTPESAGLLLLAVLVLVGVMTCATVLVALTNLRDAQTPSDERDRLIARGARALAYPVLLTALFAALTTMFFDLGQATFINAVLAAIVLGEIVRCGVEIAGYRARG